MLKKNTVEEITLLHIKIYYIATVIKKETENNGTKQRTLLDPQKYAQLIFEKATQWRKESLFKNCAEQLDIHSHKNKPWPKSHTIQTLDQNRKCKLHEM